MSSMGGKKLKVLSVALKRIYYCCLHTLNKGDLIKQVANNV